jgi:hypothetical protein
MHRRAGPVISLLALLLGHAAACAQNIKIELEVRLPKAKKTVHQETLPSGFIASPRAVMQTSGSDPVDIRWKVTSSAPKDIMKNLILHLVAVKEDQAGQRAVPRLDRDVAAETACTLDMKPGDSATGELRVRIPRPGAYLIRLETIGAATGLEGHEYFAALDLVVK